MLAARILEKIGLDARTVQRIETIPYHDLALAINAARDEVSAEMGCRVGFHPITDGQYYVGDPFDVGFREKTKHIPLMGGSVLAEFIIPVDDSRVQALSSYKWDAGLTDDLLRTNFRLKHR